jgi:hypothetical protein
MKTIKASIPIALQPGTRVLRLERIPATKESIGDGMTYWEPGYWKIWIHHDTYLTQGTYLRLKSNGSVEQVTTDADGVERVITVKDHDK